MGSGLGVMKWVIIRKETAGKASEFHPLEFAAKVKKRVTVATPGCHFFDGAIRPQALFNQYVKY
jgi:hypothetical protein